MPTTIDLFGITAEVPEGHEDFRGEFFWCHVHAEHSVTHVWRYISLTDIFASDSMTSLYWQRRVVEAARLHWIDKAISELHRRVDLWPSEEQVIGNIEAKKRHIDYWQQAENWLRIGEAAEKEASK